MDPGIRTTGPHHGEPWTIRLRTARRADPELRLFTMGVDVRYLRVGCLEHRLGRRIGPVDFRPVP